MARHPPGSRRRGHGVFPLDRVAAFDGARYVEADRTADFLMMLEDLDGRGWTLEQGGELRGFIFLVPGLGIGPLAAADSGAAISALRVAAGFNQDWGRATTIHIDVDDRPLLEEALRLGFICREAVLVMERSLDGGPLTPPPRGSYCLGLLGIP